ncbi:ervatamin-B-like [Triticum dicoccoides]|uniref:ervatamin-B-like n=2 Tax=Triticum dicoccoides TaxID=85692 RepID=UPI00189029C4|nr:ervatamin-B-like [Triticum dicoccoides]XP_037487428.1 ervatamin-B-like [Triticum dicoccoides]
MHCPLTSHKSQHMAPSLRPMHLVVLVILSTMPLPSSWGAMSDNHDLLMLGRFHRWMSTHNRTYPGAHEELRRFDVYRRNMEYIDAANAGGELGYELGENEFTDLTHEEFTARYTGGKFVMNDDDFVDETIITTLAGDVHEGRETMEDEDSLGLPERWDWNEQGFVTPAKNQQKCGACWAFATVGAVESQLKRKTGELLDLSEQELLDCDTTQKPGGCKGGNPYRAFLWIKSKGGIMKEAEYSYEAQQGQCRTNKDATRRGLVYRAQLLRSGERFLQEAVYTMGPTVAGIDTHDRSLQHFKSGIYKGPCGTALDHAVLVVGYGVRDGEKYWVVKNSWGQTFGQNGFFLMSRGANGNAGLCGIGKAGVYALV